MTETVKVPRSLCRPAGDVDRDEVGTGGVGPGEVVGGGEGPLLGRGEADGDLHVVAGVDRQSAGTLGGSANGEFRVVAAVTVAGSLPVLVKVTDLVTLWPTGTAPKLTEVGAAVNRPRGGSPVPLRLTVAVAPLPPVTERVPG